MTDALSAAVAQCEALAHSIEPRESPYETSACAAIRLVLSALPASPEAVTAAEARLRKVYARKADSYMMDVPVVLAAFAEARALLREARGEVWSLGDDEDIDQIIEAYECKRYSGTLPDAERPTGAAAASEEEERKDRIRAAADGYLDANDPRRKR